jgi:hypothetical protein
MDQVFEYEATYGPLHPREDSWAKFLAGVQRTARFTARQLYAAIAGPTFALAGLSSEGAGSRMQVEHVLRETAFGPLLQPPAPSLIVGPDGH